jgi:nicotinamidase/pyrazinamidase
VTGYGSLTALVVVDLQNDFADPSGSLYVRGGEDVVPFANDQIAEAVAAGSPVLYTQDWHPASTPHFRKDGGIWPEHCVQRTWGAAFHPQLRIEGPAVRKGVDGRDGYSGFSVRDPRSGDIAATELDRLLRERGVTRIAVAGVATDYCVVESTLDALRLGFAVTVLTRGIRAVDREPGDGDRAIERMRGAGAEIV